MFSPLYFSCLFSSFPYQVLVSFLTCSAKPILTDVKFLHIEEVRFRKYHIDTMWGGGRHGAGHFVVMPTDPLPLPIASVSLSGGNPGVGEDDEVIVVLPMVVAKSPNTIFILSQLGMVVAEVHSSPSQRTRSKRLTSKFFI